MAMYGFFWINDAGALSSNKVNRLLTGASSKMIYVPLPVYVSGLYRDGR